MDFPIHIMVVLIIANSAYSDETAFHLSLHCLVIYLFKDGSTETVNPFHLFDKL